MEARPEVISKLASYLQDKEPLVYLFIINTDFVNDVENKVLQGIGLAGVMLKDRRIIFYYTNEFLNLKIEQLYFVVLHEAFHIFKRHIERLEDIFKEDWQLANISADGIINEELNKMSFSYNLKPVLLNEICMIPEEFKSEFSNLGDKAYSTRRLYHWYKEKRKEFNKKLKKELLKEGSYVRRKDSGEYGKIVSKSKDENGEISYSVKKMTKEQIKDELKGKEHKEKFPELKEEKEENLTPVMTESSFKSKFNGGGEEEVEILGDFIQDLEGEEEMKPEEMAGNNTFLEKMFEKAKEMDALYKKAGVGSSNFLGKIEELYKSKVNWKKILMNHLNLFYSRNSKLLEKGKSWITYPWNPKSRYDILYKHFIEKRSKNQSYIILAIDTSGSCFYDKKEMSTFFTEVDAISKWLNFSKTGSVFTLQWDTEIKEGLRKYNNRDWKKFNTKGGGGTSPHCIFRYLTEEFKEYHNGFSVDIKNGESFFIPDKKHLPYLIILTDGYFYDYMKIKNLEVYKDCIKDVLFFTRETSYIDKEIEKLVYDL